MRLSDELSKNYTLILREELVAAMGCTEPIAIAYAAAKASRELGEIPERIRITCSGNMIKNVKGVTVPNSGGQKGIETAAVLGAIGGNADNFYFSDRRSRLHIERNSKLPVDLHDLFGVDFDDFPVICQQAVCLVFNIRYFCVN